MSVRSVRTSRTSSRLSAAACGPSGARLRRRRGRARGFTIPELLAVVVIIGIFAAAASPMFINVMRDRRVNRFGMEVTGLYRLARSRALGRGTAVLVRWEAANAAAQFSVREASTTAGWPPLNGNCTTNDWNDSTQYRELTRLHFGSVPYELVGATLRNETNADQPVADICFTPHGRSYIRYATSGSFTPMVGVPHIAVTNTATTLERRVLIPPNGIARMAL